jgi:hypothetical protein
MCSLCEGKGCYTLDKKHPVANRVSSIFRGNEFSYKDYYLYHRSNGPKINAYAFEITKDEEKQLYERIIEQLDEYCYAQCVSHVRSALDGIGPFKGIGELSFVSFTPIVFGGVIKMRTKMSTSAEKNDVLNRMRGISG